MDDTWQITTTRLWWRHNDVWVKYSVLGLELRTGKRRKDYDILTSFDRRCTICTEFILRCLIDYGIRTLCMYKNSVLTYFEKAVTRRRGQCWNRLTMYRTMEYMYMTWLHMQNYGYNRGKISVCLSGRRCVRLSVCPSVTRRYSV